jgi:2-C-methyl-D-erythritol 4-phosphate cytidylyltransferase
VRSGRIERKPYAAAIVPAAGVGKRLGQGRKGLLSLGGKPLYAWSTQALLASPLIGQLVLVVHAQDLKAVTAACARRFKDVRIKVVAGGTERQDSVGLGLEAVDAHFEVVLVHDAARPFLKQSLIRACVQGARHSGGAVACVPVKDSIKLDEGGFLRALPREKLWAAQTPQAYQAHLLREAHAEARRRGVYYTDEAGLCEAAGFSSVAVPAYYENFKITTPDDLPLARKLLRGFDFMG